MVTKRTRGMTRRAVSAASVIAALAIAVPANAATATPTPKELPALPTLPAFGGLPAFDGAPLGFVGPQVGQVAVAIGPTVIGSVFNGGTTVVVSTEPAVGNTIASP
jgi:hypothetical protein